MPVLVSLVVLPATSEQVAVAEPEVVRTTVTTGVTGPEPESTQFHVTVAGPLLQPKAVMGEMLWKISAGGVVSIFTGPTFTETKLPAWSRQVPVTVVPLVSPLIVVLPAGEPGATPDRASLQLNVTPTGPRFHPLAGGAG